MRIRLATALTLWTLLVVAGLLSSNIYLVGIGTTAAFYAIWAQCWNILGGVGGQVSLGHSAFISIGAYVTVILFQQHGVAPIVGVIGGVAATVLVAGLIGVLTLRLRGPYFSLATLAVAAVTLSVIIHFQTLTGGANGLSISFVSTSWTDLEFVNPKVYYVLAVVIAGIVTGIVWAMKRSKFGLYLTASDESENASAAAGVQVSRVRIVAFCLSAGLAGFAGVLYAFYAGFADPNFLSGLDLSITIALIAVVGGRGYVVGPLIGAVFYEIVASAANAYVGGSGGGWNVFILGLIVVFVVLIEPRGLVAMGMRVARRLKKPSSSAVLSESV